MSHYRDPLAGLRSQVATKRAVLESRERALSSVVRAMLPERLSQTMADLVARAASSGDSMESLATAEAALDGLLASYDEADTLAPRLLELPDELADPPPCRMPPPWLIEEADVLALRASLSSRLEAISADATISRWGDFAYIARFTVGDMPFAFVVKSDVMPSDGRVSRYEVEVRTSVPEALPRLTVKVQGPHHTIGKALHLAREIEVGERAFDDTFWISGTAPATAILTPDVRAALMRYEDASTMLTVGHGVAAMTWEGSSWSSSKDPLPDFALDVLTGIRTAIRSA